MSLNIFCDPSGGTQSQSVRNDPYSGLDSGTIFGNCSAVFGGRPLSTPTNINCADLSAIIMGDCNVIDTFAADPPGMYNTIGNGCKNVVAGLFTTIDNGENNCANGYWLFMGGGLNNCIWSALGPNNSSVVVGGASNFITDDGVSCPATYSFIGGGIENQIFAPNSYIGGGYSNLVAPGNFGLNTIAAGCENRIGSLARLFLAQ